MSRTHTVNGIIAGAVLSGCLALAGFGSAAGTAHAWPYGPYTWCPGQSLPQTGDPTRPVVWDMSVCHTYWKVGPNQGNVGPYVWDGPNPPGPPPPPPVPPLWVP
jgi:hypothetical protein